MYSTLMFAFLNGKSLSREKKANREIRSSKILIKDKREERVPSIVPHLCTVTRMRGQGHSVNRGPILSPVTMMPIGTALALICHYINVQLTASCQRERCLAGKTWRFPLKLIMA